MSLRGYRDVPYPLGSEEWRSFLNYASAYYKQAIHLTHEIAGNDADNPVFRAILTAVSSPLVYLWEKWQLMSIDEKLKYATPDYQKQLEKIKTESQKVKDKVAEEKWTEEK